MKNKDRYDLTSLDYIQDDDYIQIIRFGYQNETRTDTGIKYEVVKQLKALKSF